MVWQWSGEPGQRCYVMGGACGGGGAGGARPGRLVEVLSGSFGWDGAGEVPVKLLVLLLRPAGICYGLAVSTSRNRLGWESYGNSTTMFR